MVCRLHRQEIHLNRMQPVDNACQYRHEKGSRVTCGHACQRQSYPGFCVISKTTWYIQILDSLQRVLIKAKRKVSLILSILALLLSEIQCLSMATLLIIHFKFLSVSPCSACSLLIIKRTKNKS